MAFYMKDYGAPTSKPTMLLANSRVVARRFHNPGCEQNRFRKRVAKKHLKVKPLCRRYTDSNGKKRFAGTPQLKCSQTLGFEVAGEPQTVNKSTGG